MKKLSLFLMIALLSFASCSTNAQSEKTPTAENSSLTVETPKGMVNIDVNEFQQKMDEKDVVILDVRTPREIAQGKIKNAIEIDVTNSNFKEKIQSLDKDKTYLVYCRSGRRSVTACEIMEKAGFEKLNNLLGGYLAWESDK